METKIGKNLKRALKTNKQKNCKTGIFKKKRLVFLKVRAYSPVQHLYMLRIKE